MNIELSPVVIAALFVVIIFPVWVGSIVYFHNKESK